MIIKINPMIGKSKKSPKHSPKNIRTKSVKVGAPAPPIIPIAPIEVIAFIFTIRYNTRETAVKTIEPTPTRNKTSVFLSFFISIISPLKDLFYILAYHGKKINTKSSIILYLIYFYVKIG